ncbi:membrane protein [Clostridium polyendosporum]|uniref:Membrane protein n=1 Tax=Clostridium polyendosporum TaxID=69208 RepID=A0A919RYZ7_9CLOT|nr:aromatic acid exporter family protein [Clostridium polyendosporum]GIM28926.1 membrane protein [Clostridium polyendosporum]
MKSFIGLRTLKTAVGATVAIIIAQVLGLGYAVSAGIITILSIQNTKKTSIIIALQRFGSTVLALFVAGTVFTLVGYNSIAFGLYLIIFIPLAIRFKVTDGIVVSSVLVTHLLVEKSISPYWIKNELFLMIIGAGIGILLNTYMPKIEGKIKEDQRDIEEKMRTILMHMAKALREQSVYIDEEKIFQDLENNLREASERAYRNLNNYIIYEAKYYVQYMEMRTLQLQILKYMRSYFTRFYMTFDQTDLVAAFTERVALALHEYNSAEGLLEDLKEVFQVCKIQSLPKTREEFENRAMLFQFLKDLEYLLEVKRTFKNNLTRELKENYES